MGNRLSKIYTRTGDDGTTGNADGSRVPKDDLRVHAIGDIDELNSLIGLLVAALDEGGRHYLGDIQHRLFDLGGELSMTGADQAFQLVTGQDVATLERMLDELNKNLPALKEFILPGGNIAASYCHLARAVCRRAERHMVSLAREQSLNTNLLAYVNRLSDFLFVLARHLNRQDGNDEVYWQKRD